MRLLSLELLNRHNMVSNMYYYLMWILYMFGYQIIYYMTYVIVIHYRDKYPYNVLIKNQDRSK